MPMPSRLKSLASMSSRREVSVVHEPSGFFTDRLVPSIFHESSAEVMLDFRGSSALLAYTASGANPSSVLCIIQRRSHTNVSRRLLGRVPAWKNRSDRERLVDDLTGDTDGEGPEVSSRPTSRGC